MNKSHVPNLHSVTQPGDDTYWDTFYQRIRLLIGAASQPKRLEPNESLTFRDTRTELLLYMTVHGALSPWHQ